MSSAVSLRSESGDDYLLLYESPLYEIEELYETIKEYFREEWGYVEIIKFVSFSIDEEEFMKYYNKMKYEEC